MPMSHQIDLHLGPVQRLGFGDALTLQLGEGLGVVGLELDHVPGAGCLDDAQRHGVEQARDMTAMGLHPPLAGLGSTSSTMAPVARRSRTRRSSSRRPVSNRRWIRPGCRAGLVQRKSYQAPRACLAEQRGAEMVPEPILGPGLVGGVDRGHGRLGRGRQRPSGGLLAPSATAVAQVASSTRLRRAVMRRSGTATSRRAPAAGRAGAQ